MHSRYPSLDGMVLQCRLAPHSLTGYSDSDRLEYIRAKHIDPIDIEFQGTIGSSFQPARDFVAWRMDRMQDLVKTLSDAWRSGGSKSIVATTGYVDWSQLFWTQQSTTLEDWPDWCKAKITDEVFADLPYDSVAFLNLIHNPNTSADNTGIPQTPLEFVIPLSNEAGAIDPISEIEKVQNTPTRGITLVVSRAEDIPVALQFWTKIMPRIEPALQPYAN